MLDGGRLGCADLIEVDWVNIIDSGGQPAFHELLPFFMHDPSAALFTTGGKRGSPVRGTWSRRS